ncbi:MAG TPA: hypothetical protein DCQ20_03220, partial [Nitrospira sp.]|nr:hypothetical protein [Nitrospira sp.]
ARRQRQMCIRDSERTAQELSADTGTEAIRVDFSRPGWQIDPSGELILINNAGVNLSGHSVADTTEAEMDYTLKVNLLAPWRLAQALTPHMATTGWGRIVNINSLWGLASAKNRFSYAASKHALRALTATLALELADQGITVNEVCPAAVATDMLAGMAEQAVAAGRFASTEAYLADCANSIPTKRLVAPTSVAALVLFLCSKDAQDITGQSICVSGGM